jgi:hypothetical protein
VEFEQDNETGYLVFFLFVRRRKKQPTGALGTFGLIRADLAIVRIVLAEDQYES